MRIKTLILALLFNISFTDFVNPDTGWSFVQSTVQAFYMFETLEVTTPLMPADKPRYLMGVGKPADLVGGVARGIDMFDCVLPTRSGRTGQGFTWRGPVNLKNARHAEDPRPLDADCQCPACSRYSRAYLHHLFKAEEVLSLMLLSWHNIQYYQDLMASMRRHILGGEFSRFEASFRNLYFEGDIEPLI